MASKSKVPHGSKATLVRANPSMPAADVVKLAKQQGISLTVGHVYNIRASDKAKQRTPGSASPPADAAARASSTGSGLPRLDAQLRTLILRIGLDRAEQIFSELKSSLSRLE